MHIARHERESERMFEAMRMPIRRQPAAFGQLVATLSEKQDQQAPKNHQNNTQVSPPKYFLRALIRVIVVDIVDRRCPLLHGSDCTY